MDRTSREIAANLDSKRANNRNSHSRLYEKNQLLYHAFLAKKENRVGLFQPTKKHRVQAASLTPCRLRSAKQDQKNHSLY